MRSSFCEVDPVIKWRACLFLNSVEEAGMAFPDGGWLLSRFEWVFACSHPPPRVCYMTQIGLMSKMSSTSCFPKEFRNALARGRSAKKLKRMQKSDF